MRALLVAPVSLVMVRPLELVGAFSSCGSVTA